QLSIITLFCYLRCTPRNSPSIPTRRSSDLAYLEKMTRSEILLVMIGGMATVAGGVLAAYIGFLGGEDEALKVFYAKHLLTASVRSEEHTSELQSRENLVCRLLLEKKK